METIVRDLQKLPPSKLDAVATYVQELVTDSDESRFAGIIATAGCMPGKQGEDFEKAVREQADRIDGV